MRRLMPSLSHQRPRARQKSDISPRTGREGTRISSSIVLSGAEGANSLKDSPVSVLSISNFVSLLDDNVMIAFEEIKLTAKADVSAIEAGRV